LGNRAPSPGEVAITGFETPKTKIDYRSAILPS
jgi:hypothetical protein